MTEFSHRFPVIPVADRSRPSSGQQGPSRREQRSPQPPHSSSRLPALPMALVAPVGRVEVLEGRVAQQEKTLGALLEQALRIRDEVALSLRTGGPWAPGQAAAASSGAGWEREREARRMLEEHIRSIALIVHRLGRAGGGGAHARLDGAGHEQRREDARDAPRDRRGRPAWPGRQVRREHRAPRGGIAHAAGLAGGHHARTHGRACRARPQAARGGGAGGAGAGAAGEGERGARGPAQAPAGRVRTPGGDARLQGEGRDGGPASGAERGGARRRARAAARGARRRPAAAAAGGRRPRAAGAGGAPAAAAAPAGGVPAGAAGGVARGRRARVGASRAERRAAGGARHAPRQAPARRGRRPACRVPGRFLRGARQHEFPARRARRSLAA